MSKEFQELKEAIMMPRVKDRQKIIKKKFEAYEKSLVKKKPRWQFWK